MGGSWCRSWIVESCLDVDNPCLVNKVVSTCKMCILVYHIAKIMKWRYKKKYNRPDEQGLEKGFLCPRVDECGRRVPAVARYLSYFTLAVSVFLPHTYTKTPFPGSAKATLTHSLWGRGRYLGGRCLWEMF